MEKKYCKEQFTLVLILLRELLMMFAINKEEEKKRCDV